MLDRSSSLEVNKRPKRLELHILLRTGIRVHLNVAPAIWVLTRHDLRLYTDYGRRSDPHDLSSI